MQPKNFILIITHIGDEISVLNLEFSAKVNLNKLK